MNDTDINYLRECIKLCNYQGKLDLYYSHHTNDLSIVVADNSPGAPSTFIVVARNGDFAGRMNLESLCAARNALPALLDENESLKAEVKRLTEALEKKPKTRGEAFAEQDEKLGAISLEDIDTALAALSLFGMTPKHVIGPNFETAKDEYEKSLAFLPKQFPSPNIPRGYVFHLPTEDQKKSRIDAVKVTDAKDVPVSKGEIKTLEELIKNLSSESDGPIFYNHTKDAKPIGNLSFEQLTEIAKRIREAEEIGQYQKEFYLSSTRDCCCNKGANCCRSKDDCNSQTPNSDRNPATSDSEEK